MLPILDKLDDNYKDLLKACIDISTEGRLVTEITMRRRYAVIILAMPAEEKREEETK